MSEIDWSKAPEGATHHYENNRAHFKWFKVEGRVLYRWRPRDGWEPSLRNSLPIPVSGLTPRPNQWRGPEDGLPPVGTVAMGKMPAWRKEEKCKVIAHLHGSCVVVYGLGDNPDRWSTLAWCDQFFPLKSDKERAVGAAMDNWCRGKIVNTLEYRARKEFVENLYDAGLLRLPEEQS